MSGALAGRQTDKELEKGRVEKTTVKRYWPGKAPSWVEKQQQQQQQEQAAAVPSEDALAQQVQRTAISAPVVVKKVADPRLARLAQRSTDRDEAVEEHRQIRAAEVVRRHRPSEGDDQSAEESEDESESNSEAEEEAQQEQEEDEEELQKRRDALKERWAGWGAHETAHLHKSESQHYGSVAQRNTTHRTPSTSSDARVFEFRQRFAVKLVPSSNCTTGAADVAGMHTCAQVGRRAR
jgi:hypothetical protein